MVSEQKKTPRGRDCAIVAFGPPFLSERIKWVPLGCGGSNLEGVALFGYCLTTPGDQQFSLHIQMEMREGDKEVMVFEGYCAPDVLIPFTRWINLRTEEIEEIWGQLKIAGAKMMPNYYAGASKYEITITQLIDQET